MSKQAKKSSAKAGKKKLLTKRRGVILVVLLAVLILVVNIITFSYSWFSPEVKRGVGMHYDVQLSVRSENCTISHSLGTVTSGAIDYDTAWDGSATITVAANSIKYFRTTVTNADPNPTNISLYISELPACGLGVASPSNTYRTFSSAQTHIYILRNAYIEPQEGTTPGMREIEWFVKTGDTGVEIDLSKVYLMYN